MSTRFVDLKNAATEARNAASENLDQLPALEIAQILNNEDAKVAPAVDRALPQIARAIDMIAAALVRGGRLIYVGAGTSGRIAALDAVECPPTFNLDPKRVQFVIAGGTKALASADETTEDSRNHGENDLARKKPGKQDVVVGLAASGRTPYTVAALAYAKKKGAQTIAVICAPNSPLATFADIAIEVELGPEVLTGSTRLKAGTAQKLVLNMLSTGAMARLGYVYGNLMVNVHVKNEKLYERALRVLQTASGTSRDAAIKALGASGKQSAVALVMLKTGATRKEAERRLKAARGNVRLAIGTST
jgi:N-acetylmuramic acid 6-phosphate etherase